MYCKKCGAMLPIDSDFCYKCGLKIEHCNSLDQTSELNEMQFDYIQETEDIIRNEIDQQQEDNNALNTENKERKRFNWIYSIMIVILLIITLSFANSIYNNYKSSGDINSAVSDTIYSLSHLGDRSSEWLVIQYEVLPAWIEIKRMLKEELYSPQSAKFPPLKDIKCTKIDNPNYVFEFIIESFVDSKNVFGAEVRQNFKIDIYRLDGQWYYSYLE
jgi:hypothetical protein